MSNVSYILKLERLENQHSQFEMHLWSKIKNPKPPVQVKLDNFDGQISSMHTANYSLWALFQKIVPMGNWPRFNICWRDQQPRKKEALMRVVVGWGVPEYTH